MSMTYLYIYVNVGLISLLTLPLFLTPLMHVMIVPAPPLRGFAGACFPAFFANWFSTISSTEAIHPSGIYDIVCNHIY